MKIVDNLLQIFYSIKEHTRSKVGHNTFGFGSLCFLVFYKIIKKLIGIKYMNSESRRKRKRKPTLGGRFQGSLVAYEMGLVRLAIEAQKEFEIAHKRESKEEPKTTK